MFCVCLSSSVASQKLKRAPLCEAKSPQPTATLIMSSVTLSWSWDAQPELNSPSLGSPIPCRWGSGCVYNQCCSFVHPGEEGTGRKLFEPRNETEKAIVRLIGSPRFYERRRLRMSWPQWCAAQGMPAPVPQSQQKKMRTPCVDLSVTAEYLIEQQKKLMYQNTGNLLYNGTVHLLAECKDHLKFYDFWHPSITAGKITGILMEAYAHDLGELSSAMTSCEKITDLVADACECIYLAACKEEYHKFMAGAEPTPEMLKMAKHHELSCY